MMVIKFVEFHAIGLLETDFKLSGAHHSHPGKGFDARKSVELGIAERSHHAVQAFDVFLFPFCRGFDSRLPVGDPGDKRMKEFFCQQQEPIVQQEMVEGR